MCPDFHASHPSVLLQPCHSQSFSCEGTLCSPIFIQERNMNFRRAQGSVLTEKIVNLAFSKLHLCLEQSQQSSVLLFSPFSYPALGLGETCRSLGIPPVSSDNRLKGELDEFMFRAGSRIRLLSVQQQLVFITGSFGHVSRWSPCGKCSIWAQLLCYSSHTRPREGL